MSRRCALLLTVLLSSTASPVVAQTPQPDATGRPITPAPIYQDGQEIRPSYQPPAQRQPATGRRLDVPGIAGAASQSTSGGQSSTGWQKPKKRAGTDPDDEQLRRLDPNMLAGGDTNTAGGDYGVDEAAPEPLAGGDYGVVPQRETTTPTIAPTLLGDPLAAAPRGFRTGRFGRLRRLPEPSTLTAPGQVDPNDPYAPLGIRAGSFLLRPSLETAAGYDTNPDRISKSGSSGAGTGTDQTSSGKPKGSKYLRTRADLDVQSDWARHELDFRGSAEFRKDVDIKDSGYEPQINAALSGRIDVTERTQINAELRGSVAAARPGDPETPTGIDGEEITRNAGATLGVAQRFNRLSLRLDGLVDRFTVDDAKQKDGGRIDNADRAYNQYEVKLRGAYEVSSKLEPFAEVALDTRNYDLSRSTDVIAGEQARKLGSDGFALRGGSRFELTRLITGEASIGYGRQTQNEKRFKPVEGLLLDGSLAWAPSALTTIRLNATSALQETSIDGTAGVLSRNYVASVEHKLRRNWLVTARAGYETADYKDSTPHRIDRSTTVGLDTEYRLNRSVALTGSLERLWLKSSIPDSDYTASIIEFGLKFRR